LRRFEPNASYNGITESGYVQGVPLKLTDNGDNNGANASAIAKAIGTESIDGSRTVTLWDKLAGPLHSDFMYSVVPLVEKALVVPFVPGLADEDDTYVHRTIYTRDYQSIDYSIQMPRPLRGVGVIMGWGNMAGAGLSKDPHVSYSSFGGYFDKSIIVGADPRYKEGLIMFKHGPTWLSGVV
jgi:hypothetical protein